MADALSVTERLARREPAAAGVQTMEMKQECVGASAVGAPQVSDSANSAAFAPATPMAFTLRAWPRLSGRNDRFGWFR